jgi:hypothetical protein
MQGTARSTKNKNKTFAYFCLPGRKRRIAAFAEAVPAQ